MPTRSRPRIRLGVKGSRPRRVTDAQIAVLGGRLTDCDRLTAVFDPSLRRLRPDLKTGASSRLSSGCALRLQFVGTALAGGSEHECH